MDILYFVYPFTHWCTFRLFLPFLTIVNSATVNIHVCVFEYLLPILWDIYWGVGFLGHVVILFSFWEVLLGLFLQGERHNQRNGTWKLRWAMQPTQFLSIPLRQPFTLSLTSSASRERWTLWVPYTSGICPLGLCLAVPGKTVRWCTVSNHEASKCSDFSDNMKKVLPADGPHVTCVKRASHFECIKSIWVSHSCRKENGRKSILRFSVLVSVYCFRTTFFPQELDHALKEKEIS